MRLLFHNLSDTVDRVPVLLDSVIEAKANFLLAVSEYVSD